ncbi:MAG: hypothetical protein ABI442_14920 [Gemmatimonadaceae bacterium]
MSNLTLDQIIDALDRGHQRATYGAVAALIGHAPRTLMKGHDRNQRHSWIVSQKTGEPTGYEPDLIHHDLREHGDVLDTKESLAKWLESVEAMV